MLIVLFKKKNLNSKNKMPFEIQNSHLKKLHIFFEFFKLQ